MEIFSNLKLPAPDAMVAPMQSAFKKEAMGKESLKNVNVESVHKAHRPGRACKLLRPSQPYRAVNGNLLKFGTT